MTLKTGLLALAVFFLAAAPALADWDEGDGDKMHYPQLPDPRGWDVNATFPSMNRLADDFRCDETGPINDIHFWVSWRGHGNPSTTPDPALIKNVHFSIHKDRRPAGTYSRPGEQLWVANSSSGDFTYTYRPYGQGLQGWWDPKGPTGEQFFPDDHVEFFQINAVNFKNPFDQERGQIYWLDMMIQLDDAAGTQFEIGWKTSGSLQFEDAAVFKNALGGWSPLIDQKGAKVDFAFVITPEPATMTLLAVGGLILARRRRRR